MDRKRMENGAFLGEDYFERLLEDIREHGRLRRVGSDKAGHWEVLEGHL